MPHCICLSPIPFSRHDRVSSILSDCSFEDFDIHREDLDQDSGWETVSNNWAYSESEDEENFAPVEDGPESVAGYGEEEGDGVFQDGRIQTEVSMDDAQDYGAGEDGDSAKTTVDCAARAGTNTTAYSDASLERNICADHYAASASTTKETGGRAYAIRSPQQIVRSASFRRRGRRTSAEGRGIPGEYPESSEEVNGARSSSGLHKGVRGLTDPSSSVYSASEGSGGFQVSRENTCGNAPCDRHGRSQYVPSMPFELEACGSVADTADDGTSTIDKTRSRDSSDPSLSSDGQSSTRASLKGYICKKRVAFQLDNSSDVDDEKGVRTFSPPPRMQRQFPLKGGILKVKRSSAARVLVLQSNGQHSDGPSSSPSDSSSGSSSDRPFCRLTNLGDMPLVERPILETAPHLGMTVQELAAGVCSADSDEGIDMNWSNDDWPSLGSDEVPLRAVKAHVGDIRTIEKKFEAAGIHPVLRSTKGWQEKYGKRLNLREAFQRMRLNGDSTLSAECSNRAYQAVKRSESAADALKLETGGESERNPRTGPAIESNTEVLQESRKDSQQSYISYIDEDLSETGKSGNSRTGNKGSSRGNLESEKASCSGQSNDPSWTTAPEPIPISPKLSSTEAQARSTHTTTDESTAMNDGASPCSSSRSSSFQNFSRPLSNATPRQSALDQIKERPSTANPRHSGQLSYVDSSRLQHPRHNAWTIQRWALIEMNRPSTAQSRYESKLAAAKTPRIEPSSMRTYWKMQDQLLKTLDASHHRVPVRVARAPTPCSSYSEGRPQTPARPATPAFRRIFRKLFRVLKRLPPPRTWFKHRSKHPLVKYPRALGRPYSRTDDWPLKNEKEVDRVLFRGDKAEEPKVNSSRKVTVDEQ